GVGLVARAAPDHRADARGVGGADDGRARPVGEDHRGGPVGPVEPLRQLLGADDQHVPGRARADGGVGGGERVAEARAGGVDVERAGSLDAQAVRHDGGGVGDRALHRAGGHDHQVDVGGGQPARGQRLAARVDGHVLQGLVGARDPALLDADARADPFVAGVHGLGQLVVGDDGGGLVVAQRQQLRPRCGVEDPHFISSLAESRSSGVLSATVATPRSPRLARPVSVPPGSSSIMRVTPSSAMVAMQASQRTGLLTWSTRRRMTSAPPVTAAPSALDSSVILGSAGSTCPAASRSCSTAGAMWAVWKAPATDSGISRARAGGSSFSAASCSVVPPATIWPEPLMFAGVRPCLASAASTSSSAPPSTAVMPVSVIAAALAIACPRSRTRPSACSGVSTPASAAVANSPTLWPASTSGVAPSTSAEARAAA